jgi:opacity protein-like surface antigen
MKKNLLALLLFFLTASTVTAAAKNPEFLVFSVEPVAALQAKGNSFSSFVNYTPRYHINDQFYLRLNLGFSIFKSKADTSFMVIDSQVLGGYFFTANLGAELGAGLQNFFGNGGASPALSGNLVYRFSSKIFIVDRITAGYTAVLLSNAMTHEIRLGVGMVF